MSRKSSTVQPDVLILGAGMAGLVAAIEVTEAGARAAVVDKLPPMIGKGIRAIIPGGPANDTARAGGGGLGRFELEAPLEELLDRHRVRGWGRVDLDLMRTYLERLPGDCRWLRDDLKIPFLERRPIFASTLVRGRGPGLIRYLYQAVEDRGVTIQFQARAVKLLTDESGQVTGARTRSENGIADLHAGTVILATGGYQANHEMLLKYVGPDIAYGTVLTGCPTNTGDGHLMALELGAQMANLSTCHIRTTDKFYGEGPSRRIRLIYPLGIYLNMECQRFIDEGIADSDTIANSIAYQPRNKAALIFDEKVRAMYPDVYKAYPRGEEVFQVAQSLEDLAIKIDMQPARLKKAVDEFNAAVKDGKALGLPIPKTENAQKIDTPPFYAFYPVIPGLNHPLGGLKISSAAQVLDRDSKPIPGLYAAGSIVNWAFGKPYTVGGVRTYMGSYNSGDSSGLATALVFGRIAGREAARQALASRDVS
ncbi:MAG: FAD-dependent oxidoreductase [Dehalococcoidia bacterium]|nr:FAD-dependent oxidoreductase [Dehalococcoidia bacterium]